MDSMPALVAILVSTGFFTGVIAALFGIGGGAVYVPLAYALMSASGAPADVAMKVAVGTSLFTMFFTTLSAGTGHYRMRNYIEKAALPLVAASVVGSFAGAGLGVRIDGETLKTIFAVILLLVAARTMTKPSKEESRQPLNNVAAFLGIGLCAGVLSSLAGVGGGIVLVPALGMLMRQPFLKTVGTSSIVIIFTSLAGALTYITAGKVATDVPVIVGHVNVLYAAALIPAGMAGAWAGVRIASRAPVRVLKPLFAAFLLFMALDMLGLKPLLFLKNIL